MRENSWQSALHRRLLDYTRCPDCAAPLSGPDCTRCGLRLDGRDGVQIAASARTVAEALRRHDDVLSAARVTQGIARVGAPGPVWHAADLLPRGPVSGQAPVAPVRPPQPMHPSVPVPPAAPGLAPRVHPPQGTYPPGPGVPPVPPPPQPPAPPTPSAPTDLAAVFALAGAGLFAVAALVFAFFLVDDSPLLRAGVLVLVTGLSAFGTAMLLRRGLRASAQAVSWLTAALTVVDCWVLALLVHGRAQPVMAAAALAVASTGGVLLGRRIGLRSWASLVVLAPLVPLLLGAATQGVEGFTVGVVLAIGVALVRRPFRQWVGPAVRMRAPVESWLLAAGSGLLLGGLPLLVTLTIAGGDPDQVAGRVLLLGFGLGLAITAVLTAVQAWSEGPRAWFAVAGFVLVGAAGTVSGAVPTGVLVPVGTSVAWLALVLLAGRWRNSPLHRSAVAGAGVAVLVSALALTESAWAVAELLGRATLAGMPERLPIDAFTGATAGIWRALVAALCLLGLSLLVGRLRLPDRVVQVPIPPDPRSTPGSAGVPLYARWVPGLPTEFRAEPRPAVETVIARVLAPVTALIAAAMVPALLRPWSAALLAAELVLAVALVEAARRVPRGGLWWPILLTGALAQLSITAAASWVSRPTLLLGGVLLPVLLLRLRRSTAADLRWLHTAVVVGYPSLVLPVALSWLGWSMPTVAGLLALLLLALAVGLAPVRRVDTGSWAAVLAVAVVPVVLVGGSSLLERSWAAGWTAVAVAVVEVMALVTRNRPLPESIRVLAAATLLPTLSLGLVNVGAMLLPGSASPVLLPVIAVLCAAVGITAPVVGAGLRRRGLADCRLALEWSALGTGGLALLVALFRSTTGADTVLVVCAMLAAAASAVAARSDRRPVWWVAAGLWTGVLWTALVWGGIGVVEAYTVPPALAAALVGGWLTRRHPDRWWPLVAAGLALLVLPTLVLVLVGERIEARATALLAGAALLTVLAFWVDRPRLRPALGALGDPLAWAAGAAALAGPLRAIWLTQTVPVGSEQRNAGLFGAALAWTVIGSVLLAMVGALLADRRPAARIESWRRWALAPALAVFTVAGLCAVRTTWTVVWAALAIELAALALTVLSVQSALAVSRHRSNAAQPPALAILPPAWFCWVIALAWAIGGWSLRELRVEVYALPLGLGLTLAGLLALRSARERPTPVSWPVGFHGSMATLAPGVAATLGPSLLAIWTDPITWRAILVVGLCLVFMVVGARELLRAPLLIGSITLGLAVLSVFGSRLGSAISAGPWLLTLMSAGGLLLVLGIYAERRKPGEGVPRKQLI